MEILAGALTLVSLAWSFLTMHLGEIAGGIALFMSWSRVDDLEQQLRQLDVKYNIAQSDLVRLADRVDFLLEESARREL